MPSQNVHIKDPRSPGGGWTPADLIKLPVWLLMTLWTLKWIWRHLLPVALAVTFVVLLVIAVNSLQTAILWALMLVVIYLLFLYLGVAWRYEGVKTLSSLTRALVRRWKVKRHWRKLLTAVEIKVGPEPVPKKWRYDRNGVNFHLYTQANAKSSGDVAVANNEIAAALDAYEVKVDTPRPALSIVKVSWGDPTEREIRPGDVKQTDRVNTVAFINDTSYQAIDLPLDLSMLIVGKTGSGKSTALWAYLQALNLKGIPYRLRVIDPAGGVELGDLEDSPKTVDYCGSPDKIDDLLDRADKAMEETFKRMSAKNIRNAPIGSEFPLDILVVDEFLMLPVMDAQSHMGKRLATGRKGNTIVLGLSQLSQVDAVGRVRDLFPLRLCLGTRDAGVTNAVLGQDAEKLGAKCSQIDTPGVGYMYVNGTRGYTKFRAPNIYDGETEHIAQGGVIEETTQAFRSPRLKDLKLRRTAVYKFFNQDGRLLYTGIAWDPKKRESQHAKDKVWFPEIEHDLTEIVWYDKRRDAKKAETWSIHHEDPLYNIAEKR